MLEAAQSIVESSLRGGRFPELVSVDILRRCSLSDAKQFEDGERQMVLAGMVMARVRSDDTEASIGLADAIRDGLLNLGDRTSPVESLLALEAALAEVYVNQGNAVRSNEHVQRMLPQLHRGIRAEWRNRVLGIAAASFAIDGDHVAAEQMIAEIRVLEAEQGWGDERVEYMQAVAEAILGLTSMDAARVRAILPRARSLVRSEPTALSLVRLIEALNAFVEGDLTATLVRAGRVAQGTDQPNGPSMVRTCALGLKAIAHVMRGSPAQAVAMLRDVPLPGMHFMCLAMIRSSAYLVLGEYRGARGATDDCLRMKVVHSRWTLPATLLRRAVANMRLGNVESAVREALEALEYTGRLDPSFGLMLVPTQDLLDLGRLLLSRDRSLAPRLRIVLERMRSIPSPVAPEFSLPVLSQRERLIAHHLRSDNSYRQIADGLHVTISTVKSQASAVLKKVGASSREDAVQRLEKSGFYEL